MKQTVTTTYLEMSSADQLRKTAAPTDHIMIMQAEVSSPDLNHFLFMAVGTPWQWYSRLSWNRDRWQTYLDNPLVQTWVGYFRGTPFGYFELEKKPDLSVEVNFFGLMEAFIGRGLGSYLLACTIEKAWQMDASRVTLHTCTLDHPSALNNYLSRGFKIQKEVTIEEHIPDADDPCWLSPVFYNHKLSVS